MQCNEVKDILSAYVDGELEDSEEIRMLEHIESCPSCRRFLGELHALEQALGAPENFIMPDELINDLRCVLNKKFDTVFGKDNIPPSRSRSDQGIRPMSRERKAYMKNGTPRKSYVKALKLATLAAIFGLTLVVAIASSNYFKPTKSAESKGFKLIVKPNQPAPEEVSKHSPPQIGQLPFFPNAMVVKGKPSKKDVELLAAKVQQSAADGIIVEAAKELGIKASSNDIKNAVMIRPVYKPGNTSNGLGSISLIKIDVKIGGKIDEALAYDLSTMLVYKLRVTDSRLVSAVSDRPPYLQRPPRVPVSVIEELQQERDTYTNELANAN